MNILIGITILLTLMLSDCVAEFDVETNVLPRLAGLFFLMILPPLVASFQVFLAQRVSVQNRSFEAELAAARRNSTLHIIVWIATSLAIVCVLRWQDIVRSTWGVDHFVLFDECLILLPMLISLLLSWAIYFEQQSNAIRPGERFRARLDYVGLRCRVYLIVVLIPIGLMILLKDLWPYLEQISPALAGLIAVISIAVLLCLMPVVVSSMWSNRSIAEDEGRKELLDLCRRHGMSVNDIRIWDTGNQIVNALVAGLIPKFRILMVSDLLINSFPEHELRAILRHEAGHIRLRHLPIRIGFIFLPALALFAIELDPNQTLRHFFEQTRTVVEPNLLLGLLFIGYIVAITAWLSKNMEYEADLYSIGAFDSNGLTNVAETPSMSQSMSDALLRFGEQNPDQFARRSFTHPSLLDRIQMIKAANSQPGFVNKFRRKFATHQVLIALAILAGTAGLLVF